MRCVPSPLYRHQILRPQLYNNVLEAELFTQLNQLSRNLYDTSFLSIRPGQNATCQHSLGRPIVSETIPGVAHVFSL